MDILRPISAVLIDANAENGKRTGRRIMVIAPTNAPQTNVSVIRITSEGCIFASDVNLPEEESVAWLKFPDRAPVRVRICRANDGAPACQFAQPLYLADLESLRSHGQPRGNRAAISRARCTFVTL